MRVWIAGAAALAAVMLSTSGAGATDLPAGGLTMAEVSNWLTSRGFAPETINDSNGAHLRIMLDGLKVGVYFFDCNADGRCAALQFSVGWAMHGKFDITQSNRWNRDKRWCRGYYDAENDPWVERDVDLSPGGTWEMLGDEFGIFHTCMTNFKAMYGL